MTIFKQIIKALFSYKKKRGTIPPLQPQKHLIPNRFCSLYVIGEEFYTFHQDVNVGDFVKWIKKYWVLWYSEHKDFVNSLHQYQFDKLIESIHNKELGDVDYADLTKHLYKWYIQRHGVFRFTCCERLFVSLKDNHLLQVLYNIDEAEIKYVSTEEDVENVLSSPMDYKNNWFIGTNSNNSLEKKIAETFIPNVDITLAHFKFINDTNTGNDYYKQLLAENGITNYIELTFNNVTTIPNDDVTQARFNRYNQFNDFSASSEKKFGEFLKETPKAKRFNDFYLMNYWTDKNHPKNDTIYVNLSFGSRILTVSHNNRGFTSTTEEGARLCFYRMEDGYVTITLYPAKTENRHPHEDGIVLEEHLEPARLSNPKFLKKLWELFIAYMECTSIDGSPTYWQKRKIRKLRYYKHLIVDNVFQETNAYLVWEGRKEFLKTIGCSGFIVAIIQFGYNYFAPNNSIQENTDRIVKQIDMATSNIVNTLDSISSFSNKDIDINRQHKSQNELKKQ